MNYVVQNAPLWSVTIWDKNFSGVDKDWQKKTIKYKYLLSDELDRINKGGDVRLLYTGKDIGFTTERLAGDALCEGEIVSIPWGGTPSVKYYKGKFVTGDNRIATSSKPDELLNKYLYYLLRGRLNEIASYYRGAGLKHPAMKDILKMDISYPAVSEQLKIITQFELLEKAIELRLQQLKALDDLIKARFVEMFGDPKTNPFHYNKATLKETCVVVTGNTPSRAIPEYYGEYIEWIKTDNIVSGRLNPTTATEYLSEAGMRVGRTVDASSILMACIAGSIASIGKVCIADRKVAFNQQINAIIPKSYDILFLYVMLQISKDYLVEEINMALKGILSKSKLEEKVFILPPLEKQKKFASFVSQIDKSKSAIQRPLIR